MGRTHHRQRVRRRDFLCVGGMSMLGLGLPGLLAREARGNAGGTPVRSPSARNMILVWLGGGPSTIDMWDLKPTARNEIRGEFKPISTSADGIEICEHLPRTAQQMHLCALLRSVHHTIAEHDQGAEHVVTGNPISPALRYPSLGSIVSKKLGGARGVPAYVDVSGLEIGKAGYLGSTHNPFVVDGLGTRRPTPTSGGQFDLPAGCATGDLQRRRSLLTQIEQGFGRFDDTGRGAEMLDFQQQAVEILTTGKTRQALDIEQEKSTVLDRYGRGALGVRALAARRLIQAGVRFVTIGFSGWDTHANNFQQLRTTLLPQLDAALSTLLADLQQHGLLDETLVYCVGEFNRTPFINAQAGRDHWARSMSALVAGGGIKQGFVFGSTDKNGMEPDVSPCSPADVNATLLNQLGIAPSDTLLTRSGRPVQLFRDAHVLTPIQS